MAVDVEVKGIREALNTLARFDKELVKELRQDLAKVSAPLTQRIRDAIPSSAPTIGFNHNGRTGWPKKQVQIRTNLNTSVGRRRLFSSTVRIIITNAGVQIADFAGNRNKIKTSGNTRAYAKGGVIMTHKINNQGKFLIEALNQTGIGRLGGKYRSRYVWPTVDKYKDTITIEIDKTVQEAIIRGNERLKQKVA